MATLVIVEAPGKVRRIQSILGDGYRVVATRGHVLDLPRRGVNIAPPYFELPYEPTPGGNSVLPMLRDAASHADGVLLATDPDREGEAIAWHVAKSLGLRDARRIVFRSIDRAAIAAALASPRAIDRRLVTARAARRALDRLVGYRLTAALRQRCGRFLSAGRVQSAALRLVVERERAIRAFQPVRHYGVRLHFAGGWTAEWDVLPHLGPDEAFFTDAGSAADVAAIHDVRVEAAASEVAAVPPHPPFTTAALIEAAGAELGMDPGATMYAAQALYEQGDITYHRTDSGQMSADGANQMARFGKQQGLSMPPVEVDAGEEDGAAAAGAHEAIRPVNVEVSTVSGPAALRALYGLIRDRAVASRMAPAEFAIHTLMFAGIDVATGCELRFTARRTTLQELGWRAVYRGVSERDGFDAQGDVDNRVPDLDVGAGAVPLRGEVLEKLTQPPERFTQASLVAELQRLGIGRPSTFAGTTARLVQRQYVREVDDRALVPTANGEAIVDALVGKSRFVDLDYTREMESQLDAIAQGTYAYRPVVAAVWDQLEVDTVRVGKARR